MTWALLLLLLQDPTATNVACIDCHAEVDDIEKQHSVHRLDSISCIDCHGPDMLAEDPRARNPHTPEFRAKTSRRYLPKLCGSCHFAEAKAFARSGHHAATMATEGKTMRGCLECHAAHGTRRPKRKAIQKECLRCHDQGSSEWERGRRLVETMESWEGRMTDLRGILKNISPGISYQEEMRTLDAGQRNVHEMEVAQHGLRYEDLIRKSDAGHKTATAAYNALDEKTRAFRFRFAGLAGFLLLLGLAAWRLKRRMDHK